MGPVLVPLIRLASRVTDPLLEPIERERLLRATLGSARIRGIAVAALGTGLLLLFAVRVEGPLVDELPLLVLAAWAGVVAAAVWVARLRPWTSGPSAS
jgi:hypothetical protein